jgi:hypothetical protein
VVGDKGWTAEARITFAQLGAPPPEEGARWRLNACRTRQADGREFSAMAVTGTGGFHTLDRFQEVHFAKVVPRDETVRRGATVRALVGGWGWDFGLAAVFEPHERLDGILGAANVEIRTAFSETMLDWPRLYRDLAAFHLVVLTDLPAAYFTEKQREDLRRYVEEGGTLILMGAMSGWKHTPPEAWWQSPLGDCLPCQPPSGGAAIRAIGPEATAHALFRGIPLGEVPLTVRSSQVALAAGASLIASAEGVPFVAEKVSGKGRVIQIQGVYAHAATQIPVSCFRTDLFMSAWYNVFWGNLVQYATGRPVPQPAPVPPLPAKKETALLVDLINDNHGDLFRPGSTIRIRPAIAGRADYPYEVTVTVRGVRLEGLPAGGGTLQDATSELAANLPALDRGRYPLRLDLRKGGALVDSVESPFAVVLPLLPEDEFNFKVLVPVDYLGEADAGRIAGDLREIGFTGIFWLGGEIYAGYPEMYRRWNEGRIASRFQEHGLRVTPVWYSNLYAVCNPGYLNATPGQVQSYTKLPFPDLGYPGKGYLPYAHFWFEILGRKALGRMPLMDGYAASDEIIGTTYPESDRLRQSFTTATGLAAPAEGQPQNACQFLDYRLKMTADFVWLARSVSNAYNPEWSVESVVTPNSFCGHSSCLADVPGTLSSLGATSPDEYWYGEPKLYLKSLCSMAIAWSATGFGRLARPDFMGGQLSKSYYEEFPEQVFAAISAGARNFSVFAYDCTNFERNGRQDPRFAQIARRTTLEAGCIGRTLNHYDRARARVAMLYPHTAHLWLSLGKAFSDDYLKMVGTSDQYLPLTYAVQAEFDLLRRTFGHVDVLFDEQIVRGELRHYDTLVLAYARQVEERTLREVGRFLQHGGTLLVTTDSARLNENNQPTDSLYGLLPAVAGEERPVPADYSGTRMGKADAFSRGNALEPREGAEVLFGFPDGKPACVRGSVGRGEATVLGMPLAALRSQANEANRKVVEQVLNQRTELVSRAAVGEFSAITFLPRRGDGCVFMVFNGNKTAATTVVEARADEAEAQHVLADIVTGERVPFTVKDGILRFEVDCQGRWGRALALLARAPTKIEVSTAGGTEPGGRFMLAVRLLGVDDQPLRSTLPFQLAVTEEGQVRDDLSGVRVADQGVYAFALDRPLNAAPWDVRVAETLSGTTDEAVAGPAR